MFKCLIQCYYIPTYIYKCKTEFGRRSKDPGSQGTDETLSDVYAAVKHNVKWYFNQLQNLGNIDDKTKNKYIVTLTYIASVS